MLCERCHQWCPCLRLGKPKSRVCWSCRRAARGAEAGAEQPQHSQNLPLETKAAASSILGITDHPNSQTRSSLSSHQLSCSKAMIVSFFSCVILQPRVIRSRLWHTFLLLAACHLVTLAEPCTGHGDLRSDNRMLPQGLWEGWYLLNLGASRAPSAHSFPAQYKGCPSLKC